MLDPVLATRLVRAEWGRMVAVAMRILSDLAESEDVAQEALLEATRRWPTAGIPANPAAWLTTVTRNRALNRLRDRNRRGGPPAALDDWPVDAGPNGSADLDGYGDDRLRLIVLCCHPCLGQDAQVSLTLRLVGGLTAREIARAFVVPEPTIAQRISRAKSRLREEGARFELPGVDAIGDRIEAVLEIIYLVFNEGHGPHSDRRRRQVLCHEAVALAGQLTEIVPTHADAWGLSALLLFQSSRLEARTTLDGELVPLDEQDRARWDRGAIAAAERALAAAHNAATVATTAPVGRFVVEAEIAAQHARAPSWPETDWEAIDRLYAALVELTANPVAALNWAIARSYADSPAAGLTILEAIDEPLQDYHLLAAARADLHRRAGDRAEAGLLYARLMAEAPSAEQRAFYQRRLLECASTDR